MEPRQMKPWSTMKPRHLVAGLLLILELPVVLALAAGAVITGALWVASLLYWQARWAVLRARRALRGIAEKPMRASRAGRVIRRVSG